LKTVIVAVLSFRTLAFGQPSIPIFIGPTINIFPPAVDAAGRTIALGSTVTPQGNVQDKSDLYVGSAMLVPGVTSVGLTSDGSRAVFTDFVTGGEGVGIVDTSTGAMRRLNVDTQGCIRPLLLCISCFYACVRTPHATQDGSKVLYGVQRTQPFFVVNADGTGLKQLPVYSGALAPSPQRVISANGLVVFTSAAPFGPTFAASATDVYVMNLDGTNIRNLTKFGINASIFSSNATISADGNTIVFESNYGGSETQIWAVQSDGSSLRQLTTGPGAAASPSLSADGKTGVFVQSGQIKILEPFPGPAAHAPPAAIASFHYSVAQSPVISGDGSRVAFLLGPANSQAGAVYQVNTDGTGMHAVYAPRAINPRGVVGAAGQRLAPSPGGLVSVYGINFAGDSTTSAGAFPLPTTLAGASVLANGARLPMVNVSPWQITTQLPQDTPTQDANFQVAFADGTITPAEMAGVVAVAPDLFVNQIQRGQVTQFQAAAFHAGTAIPADDDHPAQAGEMLEMYGTGLGATDPAVPGGDASPANPVAQARLTPAVLIGNVPAPVLWAGLTPGLAGVYQVDVVVPGGLKPGRYAVTLKSGSANSSGFGTIAIQ
jgi:uncharacterized protein (TIGR03437 family)